MPSQLDYLRETVDRLSKKPGGADNPFVKGLRAQIANLEKPRAENPSQTRLAAGTRGSQPTDE
ncbi:MAG: hypothetical protein EON54_16110 [Alcaligenaceae bacterium]|nr:MAG: hypothetical protein EON54_16110 [Alcaligenaceae bacterium]